MTAWPRQTADRLEDGSIFREHAAQQRSPWEVDRDLVRERVQCEALHGLAEQDEVRDAIPNSTTRRVCESVSGCIEPDRERVGPRSGDMQRITSVSRSGIDRRPRKGSGELGQLADVDVQEALADELSHGSDVISRER